MAAELVYPHIVKDGDKPARLESTPRVRVAQIAMDYLEYGWSVDEMCRQHLYLTPAEAHAAMAYYFDYQAEIDLEIKEEIKEAEEARVRATPSPFYLRMQAKGLL